VRFLDDGCEILRLVDTANIAHLVRESSNTRTYVRSTR
jgi:hypothetical protein